MAAYKHFIELLEQEDDCNRFDKAQEEPDEKTYTAKEIADDIGYVQCALTSVFSSTLMA